MPKDELFSLVAESDLDKASLRKILDNSYEEIFVLDSDDFVIYVNSVCERHYGIKSSDLIGKSVHELNTLGYWYPPIISLVRQQRARVTLEQTTRLGWKLITTATPLFDDQGEIELILYNARDITQLDALKQELEKTQIALAEARIGEYDKKKKYSEIITQSKKMEELIEYAEQIASVDSNVLILGESGTGKGLFANYIHKCGTRKGGIFLTLNCAAIPEELLESELFGYVEGAFTGAHRGGKKGLIESANNGVLFLDEIAELSPRLQAKILQVIQDQQYIPVGSTEIKKANVRIISATNCNLADMVRSGQFRKDLYYRLNVIQIAIPPLRERIEDIVPLVHHYNAVFSKKYGVCRDFSKEALQVLSQYSWPGNVRELENIVELLVVSVKEHEIKPCHIPALENQVTNEETPYPINLQDSLPPDFSLESFMDGMEKELVTKAVETYHSSRKVARALNISETKAARLIRKHCR
jgi:PAS domain S-box-containing protein